MTNETNIAFELLRIVLMDTVECSSTQSLSHSATLPLSTHEWWSLFRLMQRNHVAALAAEGVARLPQTMQPPRDVLIPWLAEQEKASAWYRHQQQVQQEIVDLLKQHGIDTLVLKGTHTAQYYPVPELREFGDLDLYFYDKHDEADRVAREILRVSVSNDAHHHSKYNYRGVTVESHYDFVNVHYPPSNRRYEVLLKELAPTPTFEVLFLLRHMAGHFAASRITMRDLCDWTLTCQALKDQTDWALVQQTIDDYGMRPFASALSTIVEKQTGLSLPITPDSIIDADERIEHDIVYGTVGDHAADGIGRLGWKARRWKALRWKRHLVYSDSECSLLLASLTSHAEKPHSILHKQ